MKAGAAKDAAVRDVVSVRAGTATVQPKASAVTPMRRAANAAIVAVTPSRTAKASASAASVRAAPRAWARTRAPYVALADARAKTEQFPAGGRTLRLAPRFRFHPPFHCHSPPP